MDARVREGKRFHFYTVTLRRVGMNLQPSLATAVPNQLMAQIFDATRTFVDRNEAVDRLLSGAELPRD